MFRKIGDGLRRFMAGRYGSDRLNQCLLGAAFVLLLISAIGGRQVQWMSMLSLLYMMLSLLMQLLMLFYLALILLLLSLMMLKFRHLLDCSLNILHVLIALLQDCIRFLAFLLEHIYLQLLFEQSLIHFV